MIPAHELLGANLADRSLQVEPARRATVTFEGCVAYRLYRFDYTIHVCFISALRGMTSVCRPRIEIV